jgi:hypothetical protein
MSQVALDFLEHLRPNGPWVLTAIDPTTQSITTVTASNADAASTFIHLHDGTRNIYYAVNPVKTAMSKKASKEDIAAIEYLLSDLDPENDEKPEAAKARYLDRLKTFEPSPTALVDSGNGIQGLWKLVDRIVLDGDATKIADVEARSRALMLRLGGKPGTENVDRILRLPGTTNLPTKKKIALGRVACPTSLIHFNAVSYPLEAFPRGAEEKKSTGGASGSSVDVDALPVSDRIKNLSAE